MHNWSLVCFTLFTQSAIGLVWVSVMGRWFGGGTRADFTIWPISIALSLTGLGLYAALAHLTKPRLAPNALRNLTSSWLSREVLLVQAFAGALDAGTSNGPYSRALQTQVEAIRDPERTPSARILAAMCEQEEGFYQFTQRMSLQHQRYFLDLPLDPAKAQAFDASATSSLAGQRAIEAADRITFDEFLANYFAQ